MDFLTHLLAYPLAEKLADLHGGLAMLALFVFGALFTVIIIYKKLQIESLRVPLLVLLGIQTLVIGTVSTIGLTIYVPYRAAGGAREFLLSSVGTNWLHSIAFEYKENLCSFTPWLLLLIAFFVVARLGKELFKNKDALRFILGSVIVSAVFVMLTASMAVLIAKTAPLAKFPAAGSNLIIPDGTLVIGFAVLAIILLGGIFWVVNVRTGKGMAGAGNNNPLVSTIYGAAFGITLMWILNIIQAASKPAQQVLSFVPGVGPLGGVICISIAATLIATLIVWLATLRLKQAMPLSVAGWVLIACALVQIVMFFPPVYEMFA